MAFCNQIRFNERCDFVHALMADRQWLGVSRDGVMVMSSSRLLAHGGVLPRLRNDPNVAGLGRVPPLGGQMAGALAGENARAEQLALFLLSPRSAGRVV